MYLLNLNFPKDVSDPLQSLAQGGRSCPLGSLAVAQAGDDIGAWSAPPAAKAGDICVVMCAKSAKVRMNKFVKTVCERGHANSLRDVLPDWQCDVFEQDAVAIEMYAGKVAGWAKLCGDAFEDRSADGFWGNRVYAPMDDWHPLPPGLSLLGMEPLVQVNRFGGITHLSADAEEVVSRLCGVGCD